MSQGSISYTYCTQTPDEPPLPADVQSAANVAGPVVIVAASREGEVEAYLVGDAAARTLEIFSVAPGARVYAAARFVAVGGDRLFNDRYRFSASEALTPGEPTAFMETLIYREPDQIVHREEYVAGEVTETVIEYVDISKQYLPTPAPGDWNPLFAFLTVRGG